EARGTTLAGVPPFRLPREVIDRDIAGIVNENVDLRLSTYVGRDISLRELHDKNDAVLIAAGCFEPNYIGIPGEESEGVMAGIVFLERAYRGRPVDVGKRVVVLGGGYTAMDCASTSWRLGAEDIYIVYRRGRDEVVVDEEELGETEEFRVKRARDLKIDPETFQSAIESIFMAGDYRTGPTTIIEAVAEGRAAAQQVARYLDPLAAAVSVPEYHEIVTLRRSSVPD